LLILDFELNIKISFVKSCFKKKKLLKDVLDKFCRLSLLIGISKDRGEKKKDARVDKS